MSQKTIIAGVLGLLLLLALVLLFLFFPKDNFSTAGIKPLTPGYLPYSSGETSKIFLVSSEPEYAYWMQNDAHMDWFADGPIIHKGDPVFMVKLTVRNDYTQSDQYKVDESNRSHLVFNLKLYNADGNLIEAPQAYPRVDTKLDSNVFICESGQSRELELYYATGNRDITRYEIIVRLVSSISPP